MRRSAPGSFRTARLAGMLAVALGGGGPARAQSWLLPTEPAREGPIQVNLAVDLPVTVGAGLIALGIELAKPELPGPYCGLMCSTASINALDRSVVGNHSLLAKSASDGLVAAQMALPVIADLADALGSAAAHRYPGWQRDAMKRHGESVVVLAETLGLNLLLNGVVKMAVRRPRPLVYDPAVPGSDRLAPDASQSFYSQHASTAFAMATAYSTLLTLRHPDLPGVYVPIWILSEGAALATALLRVEAGKHFYTDVLVGAAVGAAIGVAVPMLHRRKLRLPMGLGALRMAPMLLPDGAGLALVLR